MPNQIDEHIKDERLQELQHLIRQQQDRFNHNMVGQALPVLFDRPGRYEGQIHGRTAYMQAVHFNGSLQLIGEEELVRIETVGMNSLSGQLLEAA
jgi:tRNA-2-methylthio-N6-dimethylallyladenosine synthase